MTEQVVAYQLNFVTSKFGELLPTFPVVFGEAVLDGDHGVLIDPAGPAVDELTGLQAAPLAGELIAAVTVELGCRGIEGDEDIPAGLVAAALDGVDQQPHGVLVGIELGGEPTLVALPGAQAAFVKDVLEGVNRLGSPAEALRKAGGTGRHHHELLEVDLRLRMPAPVENVHHRNRHH